MTPFPEYMHSSENSKTNNTHCYPYVFYRKGDKENASEMQHFGKTPSEKAMAETLMNVTNEISPEDRESIPLIESEELVAVPSSKSASNVDHKYEDPEYPDKHEYEDIKIADYHDYEDVDAAVVSAEIKEEEPSEKELGTESEEEPVKSNKDEPEEGNEEESERGSEEEPEKHSDEEQSDVADFEITAIDVEDEHVDKQNLEAKFVDEESVKPAEGEDVSQKEEGMPEVEVEPHPIPVTIEAEVDVATSMPSSTHSLVDTTVDEVTSDQSAEGGRLH